MKGLKDFQKKISEIRAKKAQGAAHIETLKAEIAKLNSELDAALSAGDEEKALSASDAITRKETELSIAQRVNARRDFTRGFTDDELAESWSAEAPQHDRNIAAAIEQVEKVAPELFRAYAAAGKARNDALAIRERYRSMLIDKNRLHFPSVKKLPKLFLGESWRTWKMLVDDERAARTLGMIADAEHSIPDYDEALQKYLN